MSKTFFLNAKELSIKGVDKEENITIEGYANTTETDRTGDIIDASAWEKGVTNYRKNPVLLYQHDHSKPIGKVTSISIDSKGLQIQAVISKAAEDLYKVISLVKDGVLKSFSVGFLVKEAKYDRALDATRILGVDLLEISVVSVPANQSSLFSIRKSFDKPEEFDQFLKEIKAEIVEPIKVEEELTLLNVEVGSYIKLNSITERFKVIKKPTSQSTVLKLQEVDINNNLMSSILDIDISKNPQIINEWDRKSGWDLIVVYDDIVSLNDEIRQTIKTVYNSKIKTDLTKIGELHNTENCVGNQQLLNKLYNLTVINQDNWSDSHYLAAKQLLKRIDLLEKLPANGDRDLQLALFGISIPSKEIIKMAEQQVEEVEVIVPEKKTSVVTVSAPQVQKLVEETGKKMVEMATEETKVDPSAAKIKEMADAIEELKGQIKTNREQVTAFNNAKLHFTEQNNKQSQFNTRDMANAVLLASAMGRRVEDTKYGAKIKAVVTGDANLMEAFSTDVYTEMQQQLVVAPMFKRIQVQQKTFRVPVADEDIVDMVAQFPSGTFTDSSTSTSTLAISAQNTISSVAFTPHKFMVKTHLAKDEEEDTVLPLVEFLRQSATRRLARSIDKAILRGDGTLSSFSSSNTLTAGGDYTSVIKGIVPLANAVSALVVTTGATGTKFNPAHIASARLAMGRYGLTLGENLVLMTTIEGYNNLVTNTDFQTVDKFGSQATYLTGSVGAVYGIPVVITEFLDVVGGATRSLAALVYKPMFMIAERRAMELESEYLPAQQVTAMYLSTRIDFHALTTVGSAALSSRYSGAASIKTT